VIAPPGARRTPRRRSRRRATPGGGPSERRPGRRRRIAKVGQLRRDVARRADERALFRVARAGLAVEPHEPVGEHASRRARHDAAVVRGPARSRTARRSPRAARRLECLRRAMRLRWVPVTEPTCSTCGAAPSGQVAQGPAAQSSRRVGTDGVTARSAASRRPGPNSTTTVATPRADEAVGERLREAAGAGRQTCAARHVERRHRVERRGTERPLR
jgi:hypothetical protein